MSRNPLNAYSQMNVESSVMAASPLQIIIMLFDRSTSLLKEAKLHMEQGNMEGKGIALSKAIDIVNNGLILALDESVNPDLVSRLSDLYEFIVTSLMEANRHNDPAKVDIALQLLNDLGDGWKQIQASGGGHG